MLIAKNATRVEANTLPRINRYIYEEARSRIERLRREGPDAIRVRLLELDEEWDVERLIEAHAALLGAAGLLLGRFAGRRWRLLTVAAVAFLARHAVEGWYPALLPMRWMGFRTFREIEAERDELADALKRC